MNFLLFFTVVLFGRFHIMCYNIDTHFPIIYSRPNSDRLTRSGYFGFSVLLHKDWIQVGAPRANSSILGERVLEPGVAYRCKKFAVCEEVELDRHANTARDDPPVMDLKNHSWIGGAMAKEFGQNGKIVVCGHRWKNQMNLSPEGSTFKIERYAITGICYISQYDTGSYVKYKLLLPPETYERDGIEVGNTLHFQLFHLSQIGMSVYIAPPSQNSVSLLMGAPGAGRYWSGGVVEYQREPTRQAEARRRREIRPFGPYAQKGFVYEFNFPQAYIKQFMYFGYQVSAGYFFSEEELCSVASSPRAADFKGSVAVYTVEYYRGYPKVTLFSVLEGTKFGGYFGYSLAVADVTGDGLDELIVGEPLYSINGDEGRIHVFTRYITEGLWGIQYDLYKKDFKDGFKVGGRFGTSLASLGDIDQDGFEDIAVGAPSEESGVIYIYNGIKNGLSSKVQRIKASDIHSSLRGFGVSISRPEDVDGNKFTDIAIGSYLSEHVVILRTYPVIVLRSSVVSYVKQFNASESKFTVKACFYYEGSKNVPSNIEVVRKIDVDINFHRFKGISPKLILMKKRNQENKVCEDVIIYKKEEYDTSKYIDLSDITIVVSQSLKKVPTDKSWILWVNSSFNKDQDEFCSSCPVVRGNYSSQVSIPFSRDCGEDGVCISDAKLHCEMSQNNTQINAFVIGSMPTLKLIVKVYNSGDPLYSPKVTFVIPREVELAHIPPTCQDIKDASLIVTCFLGVIKDKQMMPVNISLDLSAHEILRLMWEKGIPLSFNISISQDNYEDPNKVNNNCNLQLNLDMDADIDLKGKSVGDAFFNKLDSRESEFKHVYEVSNVGVSPIKRVQTIFYIPVQKKQTRSALQFSKPIIEAHQNGKSIFCHTLKAKQKPSGVFTEEDGLLTNATENIHPSDEFPSNRTFFINCSSSEFICEIRSCNFMELRHNTIAKITITPKLNFSILSDYLGSKDIIQFSTQGNAEMFAFDTFVLHPGIETYHHITVSTRAIGTVSNEIIQLWVIILCIIAGFILIAAIVFGLAKAGFFKREKKEELQALKNSAN